MKPTTKLQDLTSPPARFLIYGTLAFIFGKLYDKTLTAATDKRLSAGHINISPLVFESMVVVFAICGIGCAVGLGFTINQLLPWVKYQFRELKINKAKVNIPGVNLEVGGKDGQSDPETE